MNKRRLTFKRVFDAHTYHYSEPKITACFDSYGDGETNQLIIEEGNDMLYENGKYLAVKKNYHHYLVGDIVNRLYEYEELGYSPEELKEIIELYKGRKERLNALYGAAVYDDMDVPSLYPRLFVARGNGKSYAQAKAMVEYVEYDHFMTKKLEEWRERKITPLREPNLPEIHNVIFNDPATIVLWADGTKTVVKADKEDFDPEKGLAMAISKKALGNKGNYFDIFKKWTSKYEPSPSKAALATLGDAAKGFADGFKRASEAARSLSQTLREHAERNNKRMAVQALKTALNHKRVTKEIMRFAMEEAITYLEEEN